MLYTLSQSLGNMDSESFFLLLQEDDVIVLFQDGVVNGVEHSHYFVSLSARANTIYALHSDIAARGLRSIMAPQIRQIDMVEFVKLTVIHHPQMAW